MDESVFFAAGLNCYELQKYIIVHFFVMNPLW